VKIDPKVTFWLSIVAFVAQGIASGTVHLTGLIPAEAIPVVTGWMGLFLTIWMGIQAALNGVSGPGVGPLAAKPTVDEAKKVMEQAKGTQP